MDDIADLIEQLEPLIGGLQLADSIAHARSVSPKGEISNPRFEITLDRAAS